MIKGLSKRGKFQDNGILSQIENAEDHSTL